MHIPHRVIPHMSHEPDMIDPPGVTSSVEIFSVCPSRLYVGSSFGGSKENTFITAS
jgi:hypothetical protein